MQIFMILFMFISSITTQAQTWSQLSLSERNELIKELDYADAPQGTEIVTLVGYGANVRSIPLYDSYNGDYEIYVNKMIKSFINVVSFEAIEQSDYSSYGSPFIRELILLVDSSHHQVLGASMYVYQDGRDQDGLDNDVNWSAHFHTDENGNSLEDFYNFEWSGH